MGADFKLTESFKINGEWWRPSHPSTRLDGILNYDPDSGLTLTVRGSFEDSRSLHYPLSNENLILGLSDKSENISLVNCLMTGSTGSTIAVGKEIGKGASNYSPQFLISGEHIENYSDLVIEYLECEMFNLDEWLCISGYTIINDYEGKSFDVRYQLPEDLSFNVDDKVNGRFTFKNNVPPSSWYTKQIHTRQTTILKFTATAGPLHLRSALEYIYIFQSLLMLCIYESVHVVQVMYGTSNGRCAFIYNPSFSNFRKEELPVYDHFLPFSVIQDQFDGVIQKWYELFRKVEPSISLFSEQFYRGRKFDSNIFLNLAQCVETFHSRISDKTQLPKEEFKNRVEQIIESSPHEYKTWLRTKLNFANQATLQDRLDDLTNQFKLPIFGRIIDDLPTFTKSIKHSRNYFTHYSRKLDNKALKGRDLYLVSEKLRVITACCFLIMSGVDKEALNATVENILWRRFNHLLI